MKETLEEAARNYRDLKLPDDLYDAFIVGAKWQSERMYSKEEVEQIITQLMSTSPKKWFEQLKK